MKNQRHEAKRKAERKLMKGLGGYLSPLWKKHKEAVARRVEKNQKRVSSPTK